MRPAGIVFLAAAVTAGPTVVSAQTVNFDGSAAAIRKVVAGKTCVGQDVLTFGQSGAGSAGTFKRVGRPDGTYDIGYGTILIHRGRDVHGHVTSVSVPNHMLHMSTSSYQCDK
jgi:hypothetical protein